MQSQDNNLTSLWAPRAAPGAQNVPGHTYGLHAVVQIYFYSMLDAQLYFSHAIALWVFLIFSVLESQDYRVKQKSVK